MNPGAAVASETSTQRAVLEPQLFTERTQMLVVPHEELTPNEPPKFTVIELVPCPDTMVAPLGNVHR
jgi:hypothetical protein